MILSYSFSVLLIFIYSLYFIKEILFFFFFLNICNKLHFTLSEVDFYIQWVSVIKFSDNVHGLPVLAIKYAG